MTGIRPAGPGDAAALAAIYGHHVLHGRGTFEETPPDASEMARRMATVVGYDLPYLVEEQADGRIAGFAYASPFRTRAAYRHTVEDSVYIAPARQGQGVGRRLLTAVIAACEAKDLRQVVAMIGGSDNAGSIGLHAALGFAHVGVMPAVGFKAGEWADVVIMQRALSAGRTDTPAGPGLRF